MKLRRILNITGVALIGVGVAAFLYWLSSRGEDNVDAMLYVSYAYLAVAALSAVGLSAANAAKNRRNSKIGLVVGVAVIALGVVFYFSAAGSTPVSGADGTLYDNPAELKLTDTLLYLAYSVLAAATALLLAGEIRRAVKSRK